MRYDVVVRIKSLLEIDLIDTESDRLLGIMADKNELWVRSYCGISDRELLNDELLSVVEDLTVCSYNKMGSEGFSDETIGPIRIDYEEIPDRAKAVLGRYKRLRW